MLTEGSMIQVSKGGTCVPVEELRIGDTIFDPVAGIGCKLTNILSREVQFPVNEAKFEAPLFPVCLRAGFVGPNRPDRDILVSPKQALLMDVFLPTRKKRADLETIYADQLPSEYTVRPHPDLQTIRYFALFANTFQFACVDGIPLQITGDDLYAGAPQDIADDTAALFVAPPQPIACV